MINKEDVIEAARVGGVVGACDGLPTHVKLQPAADVVIANCCEYEPLVFSDRHLLVNHAAEVANGLAMAMQATGAERGVIAITDGSPRLEQAARVAVGSHAGIEVFISPAFYPAGDEYTLINAIAGQPVPHNGTPSEIGVVLFNVETLYNLSMAVQGKPVTERTVSVVGEVRQPYVARLPLGSTIEDAIMRAGGALHGNFRVLDGGPISGNLVDFVSQPICKSTKAIMVLPANHVQVQRRMRSLSTMLIQARKVCDSCDECTRHCTRFLAGQEIQPHQIMRVICYSLDSLNTSITSAVHCNECGICDSFACRSGVSPRLVCREIKAHLAAMGWQKNNIVQPAQLRGVCDAGRAPIDDLVERLGVRRYTSEQNLEQMLDTRLTSDIHSCVSLAVPLLQHVGAPALPAVGVGEAVTAGQLIGEIPTGQIGARVHTWLDGVVGSIDDCVTIHH